MCITAHSSKNVNFKITETLGKVLCEVYECSIPSKEIKIKIYCRKRRSVYVRHYVERANRSVCVSEVLAEVWAQAIWSLTTVRRRDLKKKVLYHWLPSRASIKTRWPLPKVSTCSMYCIQSKQELQVTCDTLGWLSNNSSPIHSGLVNMPWEWTCWKN